MKKLLLVILSVIFFLSCKAQEGLPYNNYTNYNWYHGYFRADSGYMTIARDTNFTPLTPMVIYTNYDGGSLYYWNELIWQPVNQPTDLTGYVTTPVLEDSLSRYVTLNTFQTITTSKTWEHRHIFLDSLGIGGAPGQIFEVVNGGKLNFNGTRMVLYDDVNDDNILIGKGAGGSNLTSENIGIGSSTLGNITGGNNLAIGFGSQSSFGTVNRSTSVGVRSLQLSNGSDNSVVGYNAGATTFGDSNTVMGSQASASSIVVSSDISNTEIALGTNTYTGSDVEDYITDNSLQVGTRYPFLLEFNGVIPSPFTSSTTYANGAVTNSTTIQFDIALFTSKGTSTTTFTLFSKQNNSIAIGYNAQTDASNQISLGNSATSILKSNRFVVDVDAIPSIGDVPSWNGTRYVPTEVTSGGSASFIGLLDVPSSYSGAASQLVRVNGAANALEFFTPSYLTSYTETDPLFDTKLATKTTTNLAEGSNLYFTNARVQTVGDARYPQLSVDYTDPSWILSLDWDKITGAPIFLVAETDPEFDTKFAAKSTSDLTEGSNLYWTNTRGDARYPQLTGSYSNPAWIASLAWSKISSTPTTISGYGISDAVSLTGTQTLTNKTLTGVKLETTSTAGYVWTATGTNGAGSWQEAAGGGGVTAYSSLSDVDMTGLANGDIAMYNSGSTKWEPFTPNWLTNITGITAGGDLSGTFPNPTVAEFNGQLPAFYLARANHTGTQAWSTITSTPTTTSGYGITDALTLTGSQTATNKTLTAPQINSPKLNTTSTAGYVWTATGTDGSGSWQVASGGGGVTAYSALTDVDMTGLTNGNISMWNSVSGLWEPFVPNWLTTISGISAGGNLSGTFPNPTVAQFNNQLPAFYLSRTNHTGTQLASTISNFTTAVQTVGDGRYLQNITGITAGGQLGGTYPNPTVLQFNGQLPAFYLSRTNHTGTQLAATISNFIASVRTSISLTTTGTSGAATYNNTTGVLNIPTPVVGTFTGLSDAPSSYSGQALRLVRVNTGATALEFFVPTYLTTIAGIAAGGDLSGTYASPTVARLNGQLPAFYLSRTNHTGTQLSSTISDFTAGTQAVGDLRYPQLSASYSNPSWITALAWSKLSSVPAPISSLAGATTSTSGYVWTATGTTGAASWQASSGGGISYAYTTVSVSAGNYAINYNSGQNFNLTLAADATITFSNVVDGKTVYINVFQNASGGHELTFPSNTVFPLGAATGLKPNLTTSANAHDKLAVTRNTLTGDFEVEFAADYN